MFFIGRILLHFFYLPSEHNGGQKTGTNFINIILKVEICYECRATLGYEQQKQSSQGGLCKRGGVNRR